MAIAYKQKLHCFWMIDVIILVDHEEAAHFHEDLSDEERLAHRVILQLERQSQRERTSGSALLASLPLKAGHDGGPVTAECSRKEF